METYRTCNFLGGEGPNLLLLPPTPGSAHKFRQGLTSSSWSYSLRCLMASYLQIQILFLLKIASSFFSALQKTAPFRVTGPRLFVAGTINRPVSYHPVVVKYTNAQNIKILPFYYFSILETQTFLIFFSPLSLFKFIQM